GRSAGSNRPAETSFTASAPSSSAAAATAAFVVSTERGTRTAARTARSTGRRRRRSSAASTGVAPWRVDSAPTSSMRAPPATMARATSAAAAGSGWRLPAQKESGVAFRTPTTTGGSRTSGPAGVSRTGPASGRRGGGAPETTVLASVLPEDLVDLGAVDDLALEERLGHLVQHFEI